ncbi:MAG TPA: aminotransferase class III-fold pyridoxal phosphate-dependent enzyme, partial [Parasegetibacter sp.]
MHLMNNLKSISGIENIRGRGLMIGFDLSEQHKDLRSRLLFEYKVFTGEAKPNVVRLLPALTISKKQLDEFLEVLKEAMESVAAE